MGLKAWLLEQFVIQFKRFFNVFVRVIFDIALFACLIAAFRGVVFLAETFFCKETTEVKLARLVSSISIIGGYGLYVLFDLFLYALNSWNENKRKKRTVKAKKLPKK